jgi:uncharacterized membrane protein
MSINVALTRLNRLSDLVYASSMTILIMLLEFPTKEDLLTTKSFESYLLKALPRLYLFVVTFVVVAIYWAKDVEQFKYIKETNGTHTWLQLGSLAFLVLLPWTNGLLEIQPTNVAVQIIYCADIFLIGFLSFTAWYYASKKAKLTTDDLTPEVTFNLLESNITEPIIALIAIVVSLIQPAYFDFTFILIPLLYMAHKKIKARRQKNKS